MNHCHHLCLLSAAWLGFAGSAAAELPRYSLLRVEDLYALPPGASLQVIPEGVTLAFRGSDYTMFAAVGSAPPQALAPPTGYVGVLTGPRAVTGNGGFAATAFDGAAPAIPAWSTVNTAVRYTPGGGYENLGGLNGSNMAVQAMSPNGTVAANALDSENEEFFAARYRDGEGWRALGALGPLGYSVAYAVNDSGVVVGESTNATGQIIPFLYTDAGGMQPITDNGTEIFGRAEAINSNGLVTGTAGGRAFLFNAATMELSYVTPVASQRTMDINILGQMVGAFNISSSIHPISSLAWVATGDEGFDLLENRIGQDLSDPVWRITTAQDANNDGWILANAYNVREARSYQVFLYPIPEPGVFAFSLCLIFSLLLRRRR